MDRARPWTRRSVEQRSIGKAGQRVVQRLVGEFVLHHLAAGDVLQLDEEVLGLARRIAHERHVGQRPHDRAVRPQVAPLVLVRVVAGRQPAEHGLAERHLVGMGVVGPASADQHLLRALEEQARCRVDTHRNAVEVGDGGADRRLLESDLETELRLSAHLVGLDLLGVVHHRAGDLDDRTVDRHLRDRPRVDGAHLPVRADDAELEIDG